MSIPHDLIQSVLLSYGVRADSQSCDKVNSYIDLLIYWNRRVSLTSVTQPEDILRFHFGECVFPLQFVKMEDGRLADVGSGAGFPGLAIKIFRPALSIVLLEPSRKKCAFLSEVVRRLDLRQVEIIPKRFEDCSLSACSLDFIASRALGKVEGLLKWATETVWVGGSVILWLSIQDSDRIRMTVALDWKTSQKIPGTRARAVLIGSPCA